MKRNLHLAFAILCSTAIWAVEPTKEKKESKVPETPALISPFSTIANLQTVIVYGQNANAATGGGGGGIGGAGGGGGGTAAGGGGGYGGGVGGVAGGGAGGLNMGNASLAGGAGLGFGGIGGGGGMIGNRGGNGAGSAGTVSGGFINSASNGVGGGIAGASKGGNGFGGGGGTSVGGGGGGVTQGGEGFGILGATNAGAGGSLGITPSNLSIGTGNTQTNSTDAAYTVNGGVLAIFGGSGGGGGKVNSGSDAGGVTVTITSQTAGTINLLGGVGGGGGMLSTVHGGNGAGSIISSATITGGAINVFGGAGGGGNSIGLTGSSGGNATGGQLLGGSISGATLNVYGGANGQNASILGFGTGTGGTGGGGYVSGFTLANSSIMNMYTGANVSSPNSLPAFGGNGSRANNMINTGGALNLTGGTLEGTYNQSGGALNLNGGVNNATCIFSGGSVNNTSGTKNYTLAGASFTGGNVTTSSVGTDSLIFTNATVSGSNVTIGNNVVLSGSPTTTISSGTVHLNPGGTLTGNYTQTGGTINLNGGTNNATSTISGGAVNSTVSGTTLSSPTISGRVTTDATPGSMLITDPTVTSSGDLTLGKNVTLAGAVSSGGNVRAMTRSLLRGVVVNGTNVTVENGASVEGATTVNSGSLAMAAGSTLSYDLVNYTGGITLTGGSLHVMTENSLNPTIDLTSIKAGLFSFINGTAENIFSTLDLSSVVLTYNGNPISTSGYATQVSVSPDGSSLILTVSKAIADCTIAAVVDQVYTRSAITPSLVIMNGSNQLSVNSDYQLSYANNQDVGTATITVTGIGNYTGTKDVSFTITPLALTITADPKTKAFGRADPTLTYQVTSGGLVGTDAFTGVLTREPGETVGSYAISQGTLVLSSNYTLTYIGKSLTINKADQTITFDQSQLNGKKYGDAPFTITATSTSGLPVTFTSSDPTTASVDASGLVTMLKAGAVTITASQAGDASYSAAVDVVNNLAINSASASVFVVQPIPNQPYTGSAITPTVAIKVGSTTLVLGQDYTVSYVNNINAGPTIATITGVGSYSGVVNAVFDITPLPITVTADAQTKVYGTTDPSFTYQITSGALIGSDTFTGGPTRNVGEGVGSYVITQGTLALSANYTLTYVTNNLTITQASQAITFDPSQLTNKQYGDNPFVISATASSALPVTFTSSDPTIASVDGSGNVTIYTAGTVTITATQTGNNDYSPATDVSNAWVITGKPITASSISITPISSQAYTGSAITPSFTVADNSVTLVNNTDYQFSYSANTNVGTATITITGIGNYSGTTTTTFTILPVAITVSALAETKSYGAADPILAYQITSGTLASGDTFTGALSRNSGEDVGNYMITQGTLALSSNYTLIYIENYLTITKANQTITFDQSQLNGKEITDDPFTITATASSGLPVTFTSSNPTTASVDASGLVTMLKAGAVTITASQIGNNDYSPAADVVNLLVIDGRLLGSTNPVISPIPNMPYTGIAITPLVTLADDFGPFVLGIDYTLNYVNNINAGVGTAIVTINGIGNYGGAINTSFTITPRPVTVTADSKSKTYGASDPVLTYQTTSGTLAIGDSFTGALSRDPGENGGNYTITQGTLALSSNYALTYVGNTFAITKVDQTITFNSLQLVGKQFGSAPFALSATASSGLPVTFTSSDPTVASIDASGNVTILKAGSITITASQSGNTNYNAAVDVTYPMIITAKSLSLGSISIELSPTNIVYTGLPVTPTVTITYNPPALFSTQTRSGLISLVEGVDFTLGFTNNLNAGTATVNITGLGNFTGALSSQFTILPRPVTVTANSKSKTYATSDPTLTYQITSGTLGGADAFTGALTRSAGENAGSYPITQGTLALSSNYALTYVGASLAITPANQLITFDASQFTGKQFGSAPFIIAATASSGLPVAFSSSDPTIASVDAAGLVTIYATGTVSISAAQAGNKNYNPASAVVHTLTIGDESISTGVSEVDVYATKVYPNPVETELIIQSTNGIIRKVRISTMGGYLVYVQQGLHVSELTLDASTWTQAGAYLVIVETDRGTTVHKIIKK